MPPTDDINWQPIGEMPLIAGMNDGSLEDTREHLATLTEARPRPHMLDDATLDRSERVHREQAQFVAIYAQQIGRWRVEEPSAVQLHELNRMEGQNRRLGAITDHVLALVGELRKGSIDQVMRLSDAELGLQALLRGSSHRRR